MDVVKAPVLLIDDDSMIAEILSDYLNRFEFDLKACPSPSAGMALLRHGGFKVLLLDIMLPEISGFEVCKQVREISDIPIIMLTAKGAVDDKVLAFDCGADDYLAKPFEPRELVARMQRLLKRRALAKELPIEVNEAEFKIDKDKRQVVINNTAIDLTSIEFDILTLLSNDPGTVFDRNRILQHVKGLNDDVTLQTRAIDNSISRLRRKLNVRGGASQLIRTVWGQGYSFTGLAD